jgi:hypothetical protein
MFDRAIVHKSNPPHNPSLLTRLRAVKLNALETLETLRGMLDSFERLHSIEICWTADSPEWKRTEGYVAIREYQKALDKLEGLVVQWLFELAKMGLSGTGSFFYFTNFSSFLLPLIRIQNADPHQ